MSPASPSAITFHTAFCALLLLLATSGAALAMNVPNPRVRYDWSFAVGGYRFGLAQIAAPADTPGRPDETIVFYGPSAFFVRDYSAPTLATGLAAVVALVVLATGLLARRHRLDAPLSAEP